MILIFYFPKWFYREVIRKWLVTSKIKLRLLNERIMAGDAHGNDQSCIIIYYVT